MIDRQVLPFAIFNPTLGFAKSTLSDTNILMFL